MPNSEAKGALQKDWLVWVANNANLEGPQLRIANVPHLWEVAQLRMEMSHNLEGAQLRMKMSHNLEGAQLRMEMSHNLT